MSAFKAYDIRGIYNQAFNKEDVYRIGFFLKELLSVDTVLVGYDDRESSPEIFEYLCKGITDSGANVVSAGYATTPMIYFATAKYGFGASVQITASHNSKEYNGLKISKAKALPVGADSGLKELEAMVNSREIKVSDIKGSVSEKDVKTDYIQFLKTYAPDLTELMVGIDCSNGMASLLIHDILGDQPHYIYDTMDGTFPNHEPNPLIEENVADLKALVKQESCDIGVIYDGDADRVMFVDENGTFISPDLITGILAEYFLSRESGAVLHDIRTSKAVSEYVEELGGTVHIWKVGHAFAKLKLKEINGIVGGELAGHYYFRDFFNCDSGILASLIVLSEVAKLKAQGKTLSGRMSEIARYSFSGEMNFHIEDKSGAMAALTSHFSTLEAPLKNYDFDGYRLEFSDWWFNVRPSNTEPLLRLVVEAKNDQLLAEKVEALKSVLAQFS